MNIYKTRSRRKSAELLQNQEAKNTDTQLSNLSGRDSLYPWRDFTGSKVELFLTKLFYYIRLHIRQFALGFLAIIFIFFLFVGYVSWDEHQNNKSIVALQKLLKEPTMNLESGAFDIAVEKIDEYSQQYQHGKSPLRAMLFKKRYLEKGDKFEEAAKLCVEIAKKAETPELKMYFYLRSALHEENLSNYNNAEQSYRMAAEITSKKNKIKALALFGQGRMLTKLGKKTEARKVFQKILSFDKEKVRVFLAPSSVYLLELGR